MPVNSLTQPLLSWRLPFVGGALLALAALAPVTAKASERWETLEAIHWIENPSNSSRPGRHGELGAYQFRESTWRMHTNVPFYRANDRRASDDVAVRHYEWIKSGLVRNGIDVTPYNVALVWNGGLAAVVNGNIGEATRDYAERVTNMVEKFRRPQQLASAQ
jgi:hypothetical protein